MISAKWMQVAGFGIVCLFAGVSTQDPSITITGITGSGDCLIDGQNKVVVTATADFTGIDPADWLNEVQFADSISVLCQPASLLSCSPERRDGCYCQGVSREVYTVVMNATAAKALDGRLILAFASKDVFTSAESNQVLYPSVCGVTTEFLTVDGVNMSLPANGSCLEVGTSISYTILGLEEPYVVMNGSTPPSPLSLSKLPSTTSVITEVDSSVESVYFGYQESGCNCMRNELYHFCIASGRPSAPVTP